LTISYITIWIIYIPQSILYPDIKLQDFEFINHNKNKVIDILHYINKYRLLPKAYTYDIYSFVTLFSNGRVSYFWNDVNMGNYLYFPGLLLFKTPIPTLLLSILILPAFLFYLTFNKFNSQLSDKKLFHILSLIVYVLIYFTVSVLSKINLGLRHLLPIYPAFYILLGLTLYHYLNFKPFKYILILLSIWSIKDVVYYDKQLLSYFNQFSNSNKDYIAIDSSLDWGQDLPAVEKWINLNRNRLNTQNIYFSYFGNASLSSYNLPCKLLPQFFDNRVEIEPTYGPGTYIISATMLHSLYSPHKGKWIQEYENLYANNYNTLIKLSKISGKNKNISLLSSPEARLADWLRFERLCAYLRCRKPDELISYSQYVYYLDSNDLQTALDISNNSYLDK